MPCLVLVAASARGGDDDAYCSNTAALQFSACKAEVQDDLLTAKAICINLSHRSERRRCLRDAEVEYEEGRELCGEQLAARRDLCDALGEERYDPDFDPDHFDTDFTSPNPYFPLSVGDRWNYAGGAETVDVEVLDETKRIEDVICVVVRDVAREDGRDVEDTDDWIAQRKNGGLDYCGEISQNFEFFEGDDPEKRELVDVDGSWKAGRDGARPGTLFPTAPVEGAVYRQEWAAGDAEDAARVLSTHYRYGQDAELDEHVPAALVQLLCSEAEPCVVTAEFTPVEPDAFERKYYARGVGLFLEVDPESGDILQLVDCNVDPSCASLPQP